MFHRVAATSLEQRMGVCSWNANRIRHDMLEDAVEELASDFGKRIICMQEVSGLAPNTIVE